MRKLSYKMLNDVGVGIAKPKYNRADLRPGIVHFGVGNFHRSHMQRYLHQLFNQGQGTDWGVIGTGVTGNDLETYRVLKEQDYLTTLIAQDNDANDISILGVMTDFIPPNDGERLVDTLTCPHIRIVSLTVTEGGYFVDASNHFDDTHSHIQWDAHNPQSPKTVFGIIIKALSYRRERGIAPFTIMSCDNLSHNGDITRHTVVGLARLMGGDMATWIDKHVAFPNSMVDCITPATGQRERDFVKNTYRIVDGSPVFCEQFTQWVLEDTFTMGRPPLEDVGVQIVDDVSAYEKMKIRLLNGGHAIIAYPSGLMDIEFVHEAMANTLIRDFLYKVERNEIFPLVSPVGGMSPQSYYDIMEKRLLNYKIGDTVKRLCLDGFNRQPKFIVASIKERLQNEQSITGLALVSALWCRYCYGVSERGNIIEPNDSCWDILQKQARLAKDNPTVWLTMDSVYGDIGQWDSLQNEFTKWLTLLWQQGVEKTLQTYIKSAP